MPVLIPVGFLFQGLLQRCGQIHLTLIGQTKEDPKDVRHLGGNLLVGFFGLCRILEGLVPVGTSHPPRQLTHFFGEDRHIGQWGEIPDTNGLDPVIHLFLRFFNGHVIRDFGCR